jgi:hypothetical protein
MAFRRTNNIVDRLVALAESRWDEPAELAVGGAGAGPFAGAVLQTIAPGCETPELSLIRLGIDPADLPDTFDDLANWLVEKLDAVLSAGDPRRSRILNALTTQLNTLKDNDALSESTKERLYNEAYREVMSACFGRRDAQWALRGAIRQARRFIYIESPGIAATKGEADADPRAVDLLHEIGQRMNEVPGLHVILCTPKELDYAPGYEPVAAHEVHDRFERIRALPTAKERNPRVTAFHPIGFPGRSSALEATVVVVDDTWVMVGASAFRRRGLTFDGGSDLVLTDSQLVDGRSPAIGRFRKGLMASRLGVATPTPGVPGFVPDPNFTRLEDGVEAFYLVREMLQAGGLGKIDRLWNGLRPGVKPIPPDSISPNLANPEGSTFPLSEALSLAVLTSFRSF